MTVVEIRRRRPDDGQVERLARVYARGPGCPAEYEVLAPDFREGLDMVIADGVTGISGRQLYLADGDEFVAALPEFYRGSRFWAEEVSDVDVEQPG
ncbi:MAG: hypothetical protein ACR2H0_03485 [Candidatus Limnocylindrales bacterium]